MNLDMNNLTPKQKEDMQVARKYQLDAAVNDIKTTLTQQIADLSAKIMPIGDLKQYVQDEIAKQLSKIRWMALWALVLAIIGLAWYLLSNGMNIHI